MDVIDPHTGQPVEWIPLTNWRDPYSNEALLRQAGLWDGFTDMAKGDDWQVGRLGGREGGFRNQAIAEAATDWNRLAGYTRGTSRKDYEETDYLRDPSGKIVAQVVRQDLGPSLRTSDYASMAAVLAAAYGANNLFGNLGAGSTSPIVSSVPQAVAPDLAALGTAGTGSGVAIGGGGAAGGAVAGGGGIAGSAMAPGAITSTVPAATVPSLGAAGGTIPTAAGTTIAGSGGTSALARVGTGLAGQLISGAMQANAAQNASAAQQAAAAQGQASLQGVYDRIAQLMQPFVGAGVTAIDAQQALIGTKGPEAQRAAIAALESSPEFSSLVKQGEEAILANASATGGLRGGNVQAALGQFRPAVLSRLINQQIERLAGLSQQGQNAAAGVGTAGVNIGTNQANLMQQSGAAQAGGELARGQTNAGYVNAITNAIGMYFGLKGG